MTPYTHDMLVIGLGPAGMAVSIMASAMGLKVCAIERNKIGGECMNVGCIPSKSLLRMGKTRALFKQLEAMELEPLPAPKVRNPFHKIREYVDFIGEHKTKKMFEKVDLILGQGDARFTGPHTVETDGRSFCARKIYICTGTRPALPPIPGLEQCDPLTNENLFDLTELPKSLLIIGGGAIGCEMAQAFNNLGCPCTIVHMDAHLLPAGDPESGQLLEEVFVKEGIHVYNGRSITRLERREGQVVLFTAQGEEISGERLLLAAGRRFDFSSLNLEAAGVQYGKRGITVNSFLQTTQSCIYAPGDCNGHYLLTHTAMHQGMIALMNSMLPRLFRRRFERYVVPWTVFTSPAVSHAGKTRAQLEKQGIRFEEISERYADY
ncbi:MAG: FAD-dependent oxidoreductase, partial [Kiritimatiellae bacterium]|nr:FAD-dependent oxidoreductase [Kiritimatiellia bacterium]